MFKKVQDSIAFHVWFKCYIAVIFNFLHLLMTMVIVMMIAVTTLSMIMIVMVIISITVITIILNIFDRQDSFDQRNITVTLIIIHVQIYDVTLL